MSSNELTAIAQKAARGSVFLFVGFASSTVILAVGIVLVARLLGPSSYGLYTLALVIPTLLISLSDVGIRYGLIRSSARLIAKGDPARAGRVIRLGFMLKLAFGIVASVICYIASMMMATNLFNRPELAPFLRFASLIIVFQSIFDAATSSFIGQDRMQDTASVQIMQSVLKCTLGPAFILIGLGVAGAIWGYVLALAAAGLTGATVLFTRHTCSSRQTNGLTSMEVRSLFGYGLPLYLAAILTGFLTQYQNIVLANVASNVEIGNFGATWNFTLLMTVLIYPIVTPMFPMFSKIDPKSQRSDLSRAFVLAVKYTSLVMVPASVTVMIFSRNLVYVTFGRGYALAPQYLMLLAAFYVLAAIGDPVLANFLYGVADTGIVLKMSVVTLAVYLPLGPVLAWLWGPFGLLIAYIICNAAGDVYALRQISGKYDARPDLRAGGRIIIAALGAAVPTLVLIQLDRAGDGIINLAVGGLLYVLIYLTLAPVLRAVDRQDILNLRTLLGNTRMVATFLNLVLIYELKLLSTMKSD